jgi:hypothetical protein
LSIRFLQSLLLLAACSGGTVPEVATQAPVVEPTPMAEHDAWKVLSPSPLDLEKEVQDAGLGDALSALVPAGMPAQPPDEEKDRVAFRTGIVFSFVVLSGRKSEKAAFLEGVRSVRSGMATIGTGGGLLAEMDEAIVQVENDTASREDFLTELNAMVETSVPEDGWGPTDTTGPMLQAGAWLAGINLVARAVVDADNADAANTLLRRPEVAEFFMKYIRSDEGAEKAGSLQDKVAKSLEKLHAVASKDKLEVADAKEIIDVTNLLIAVM